MADIIDELQIEINASASKANDAIDRLVGKLDRLTTTLTRVDGTSLRSLANGVERLGASMQIMNTIKTADFTRLAKNLINISKIDFGALNNIASSLNNLSGSLGGLQAINSIKVNNFTNLARSLEELNRVDINTLFNIAKAMPKIANSFNRIGKVSDNAKDFGTLAKNIGQLAARSTDNAITNIPRLGEAIRQLFDTLSNLPAVNANVTTIIQALSQLSSQSGRVGTNSNRLVNGLNRTTNATHRARNGFKGLASYIGKFYATYFMVIRGLKGLWSSIESTADYIEAYNYFNVSLGKIGADWKGQYAQYGYDNAEVYAQSFSKRLSESLNLLSGVNVSVGANGQGLLTESGMKNLGLNIQEITQYASQLASVTNSVGQTGETSLAIAKNFTRLAGDISSLFNVDYSSVSTNLQSGLIGQSRALYKYGIDITNATLQTYAYNLGLEKAVKDMTQAEKMQLRMIAILDQSKVSWGDLANTINSPSNMIRQLSTNLKETGMILGQLFIPVLQKVLPAINGLSIAFKRLLVDIAGFLNINIDFDSFGQGYTDIEDGLDNDADAFENATEKAKEYKNQLMGFDEVNRLTDNSDTDTGSGSSGTIDLTAQILAASNEYEKVWKAAYDKMENQAIVIANRIDKAFQPLKNIAKYLIDGDVYEAGTELAEWINKGLTDYDWGNIGTLIGRKITGTFDFVAAFTNNLNWSKLARNLTSFINNAIKNIKPSSVADAINGLLGGIWDFAVEFISTLDFAGIVKSIAGILKNLDWGLVISSLSTIIAFKWFGGAAKKVVSNFAGNIASAITDIAKAGTSGASLGIAGVLGTALVVGMGAAIKSAQEEAQYWEDYRKWLVDISMPTEEWQARIDELANKTQELVDKANERIKQLGEIDVNYIAIQNMADEYFKLAEKQDKSNEEIERMQLLHDTLIKEYPQFKEILDDEKTSYDEQKKSIQDLITEMKNKAKQQAIEEMMVQTYKDQYEAQQNLAEATKNYEEAYADWIDKESQYKKVLERYNELKEDELILTGKQRIELAKLTPEYERLREESSRASANTRSSREEMKKAQQAVELYDKQLEIYTTEFSKTMDTTNSKTKTTVNETKSTLSDLTSGFGDIVSKFKGFGENILDGLKSGLNNSSKQSGLFGAMSSIANNVKNTFANIFQIHSPSKLFEQFGKYTIEGYQIGVERNADMSIKAVRNWGNELTNMATASVPDFSYTSKPNYSSVTSSTNIYNNAEEVALMRQQNALLQALVSKENVVISADTEGIFKMVQNKANNYTRQNGKPAFIV